MTFASVNDATKLWMNGRQLAVAQDCHCFHSFVAVTIGELTYIAGEYYMHNVNSSLRQLRMYVDIYIIFGSSL